MIFNYIRFDSIFEFGANYQLTENDMRNLKYRLFSIPTGLLDYLFSIPNIGTEFPYLFVNRGTIEFYGFYYSGVMAAGLFILNPILLAMLFIPKMKKYMNKECFSFIISLTFIGIVMLLLEIVMGGSCQRYVIDFGWMFTFVAILIVFTIYDKINHELFRKYIVKILVVIAILTSIINFLLSVVQGEENSLYIAYPEYYYSLKYSISFWK